MSWSVSAIGKPAAVAAKLATDFAKIPPMEEPEATGKSAAATAVAAIVPAFPGSHVVRVECSGSQYDSSKAPKEKINQLTISISTLGAITE